MVETPVVLYQMFIVLFFFILVLWHLYLPLCKIYETALLVQKGCDQSKMGFYDSVPLCSVIITAGFEGLTARAAERKRGETERKQLGLSQL